MRTYLLVYLLIINAIGFTLMLYDKKMAKRRELRIPEKHLFAIALIGGAFGCVIGMYTARHKTKHKNFTIGMPAILLVQLLLIGWFFLR